MFALAAHIPKKKNLNVQWVLWSACVVGVLPLPLQTHFPCSSALTLGGWPSENVPCTLASWLQPMEVTAGDYRVAERQDRKVVTPSTRLQFASGSISGHSFCLEVRTVTAPSGFRAAVLSFLVFLQTQQWQWLPSMASSFGEEHLILPHSRRLLTPS